MRIIKGFGEYLRTCSALSGADAAFHTSAPTGPRSASKQRRALAQRQEELRQIVIEQIANALDAQVGRRIDRVDARRRRVVALAHECGR